MISDSYKAKIKNRDGFIVLVVGFIAITEDYTIYL